MNAQLSLKEMYEEKEKVMKAGMKGAVRQKNEKITELKGEIKNLKQAFTGYSMKHLFYSFGFGASCVVLLWWLQSRK